jgi:hypothetical protein
MGKKFGNQSGRSSSRADEGKIGKLAIIWEHQATDDANTRVERAFEMLLGDELDTLSTGNTIAYHNKDKGLKESDPNPQVGGQK